MTPAEAAMLLERLPAAFVKLQLVRLLEWQATKGLALVHMGWYLRCLQYADAPRPPKTVQAQACREAVKALTAGIGSSA